MRDAFRAIDTSNTGIITLDQVKKGFVHDNYITHIDHEVIEQIFSRFDFNKSGQINYSEFLAAAVDKQVALQNSYLEFAFHHFDTDNEGYITKNDLKEVFKRSGRKLSDNEIMEIIREAHQDID